MRTALPRSALELLECSECGSRHAVAQVGTLCAVCPAPLLAQHDLPAVRSGLTPAEVAGRPRGLWRWHGLLPVCEPAFRFGLGECDSPLFPLPHLGAWHGCGSLKVGRVGCARVRGAHRSQARVMLYYAGTGLKCVQ